MIRLPFLQTRKSGSEDSSNRGAVGPEAKAGGRFVPSPFAPPGLEPTPRVIYRTRRKELSHIKRVGRLEGEAKLGVWRELADGFIRSRPMPPAQTAGYLLERGFAADRALLYDLPNDQVEDYLTDLQVALLPGANGKDSIVLENRVLFSQVFGNVLPFARRLCSIRDGHYVPMGGSPGLDVVAARESGWLHAFPAEAETAEGIWVDLAARLIYGAAGVRPYSDLAEALLEDGRDLLVVEDPGPHGPIAASGGQPANRLRLFILRSADTHLPEPSGAVYSIATGNSSPLLSVRGGAISASVNLDSGRLNNAIAIVDGFKVHTDSHLGTGAPIVGEAIPEWERIVAAVQQAMRIIPMFAVVQFDLALTPGGFVVLDAKSRCDAPEFQVHGPLMGSLRAQSFLREYGL